MNYPLALDMDFINDNLEDLVSRDIAHDHPGYLVILGMLNILCPGPEKEGIAVENPPTLDRQNPDRPIGTCLLRFYFPFHGGSR